MKVEEKTLCPYCHEKTIIALPSDYAPTYVFCRHCNTKFIVERRAAGFVVFTLENAPCCSDPDCKEIEMAASDEQ
jgi:DNA-directed RNA polymerase subunit RPC12/RpoP